MTGLFISLDDYIITTFTKPTTFSTISTFVFDAYAKGGRSADVPALRALSTIIFLVIVLMLIVKNLLASKGEKTGGKK
jgi:spermidine/putrescine transport system permease protein